MLSVFQVAANYLIALCQRIGPDLTAFHVLPKLKELFDELAFSQETSNGSGSLGRTLKFAKSKVDEEAQMGSRMDLVWVHGILFIICLRVLFRMVLMFSSHFAGCFYILPLHLFLELRNFANVVLHGCFLNNTFCAAIIGRCACFILP